MSPSLKHGHDERKFSADPIVWDNDEAVKKLSGYGSDGFLF